MCGEEWGKKICKQKMVNWQKQPWILFVWCVIEFNEWIICWKLLNFVMSVLYETRIIMFFFISCVNDIQTWSELKMYMISFWKFKIFVVYWTFFFVCNMMGIIKSGLKLIKCGLKVFFV